MGEYIRGKSKNKPPAFQLYVKDWLSSKSVLAMSPAQCGYFINLLAHAWDNDPPGTLPNRPELLWKLARAESREIFEQESVPVLRHFPPTRSGLTRFNLKLITQFRSLKTQKRQRRDAAKSRWLKEKNAGASIPASIPQCSASASASASAKHNPPTPLAGGDGFGRFWEAYPKKVGKGEALKSWKKIRPSGELVAKILGAVHVQRGSEQWRKESGQFIPNPATWLNQTRWEDELDTARPQAPKIMGNCPACQGAIREGDEVERSKSGRDYHSNCLKVIRERAEIEKNRGANV